MNITELKSKIGDSIYQNIERVAQKEVRLAMKMPLTDKWGKDRYYNQSFVQSELLEECKVFEEKSLKISPLDIFHILFNCQIFLASKTENEYHQRLGGAYFHDESRFTIPWNLKGTNITDLADKYLDLIDKSQKDRSLLVSINSFRNPEMPSNNLPDLSIQEFFSDLFEKLDSSFKSFFQGNHLIEEHEKYEPNLASYDIKQAENFFQAPSVAHSTFGSERYCRLYSGMFLRVFLNMLRISGFVYPGQIDFGQEKTGLKAPTSDVFLGTHTHGCFCWREDKKEPWAKTPDGCLFLSFGYRGLQDMWIDRRTYGGIKKFFIDNLKILNNLKNPWTQSNLHDVIPTLDILSSATQVPDTGAKILQIYCCLEHLFVPKNIRKDNKKYIVGGINALDPNLMDWFNELYDLRCEYAHKGYIVKDEKTIGLIVQSVGNIMSLLNKKISTAY